MSSMSQFIRRRSSSKLSISSKAQRSSEDNEKEKEIEGKFEKEFFIISELGKGEFSEAFIACKRDEAYSGKMYAIKRGKPFEGGRDR